MIDENWESLDSRRSARMLTLTKRAENGSSRKRAKEWARSCKETQNGILSRIAIQATLSQTSPRKLMK